MRIVLTMDDSTFEHEANTLAASPVVRDLHINLGNDGLVRESIGRIIGEWEIGGL